MDNLLGQIKKEINEDISKNRKQIEELNKNIKIQYKLLDNINEFLKKYSNNNIIDFSSLKLFIDCIDFKLEPSIDEYEEIVNSKARIKMIPFLGKYLLSKTNEYEAKLIKAIERKVKELSTIVKDLENSRDQLLANNTNNREALRIVKKIINNDITNIKDCSYDFIINYIKEKRFNFSDEQINNFEQHINKIRDNFRKSTNEKLNEESTKLHTVYSALEQEQMNLYNTALKLLKYNCKLTCNEEDAIFALIDSNTSLEERFLIYKEYTRGDNLKYLIIRDIQLNIIPQIDNDLKSGKIDKKIFDILKCLLDKINILEEENKFNYIEYLIEINDEDSLNTIRKIQKLLETIDKEYINNKFLEGTLKIFINNLKASLSNYTSSLYQFKNNAIEESKLNETFDVLKQNYEQLLENFTAAYMEISANQVDEINMREEYFKKALEFYNDCFKIENIIIFLDDDNNFESIVESDIETDKVFSNYKKEQVYRSIINKLRQMVMDNLSSEKGHQIKSKLHSEKTLDEFGIRSKIAGSSRIFYGRYGTNSALSEKIRSILPNTIENPSILFISRVGYGAIDGNSKENLNLGALKRCTSQKKHIEEIKNLIKTDLSELSNEEKIEVNKKIDEFIERHFIKLGHLLTCISKNEVMNEPKSKKLII